MANINHEFANIELRTDNTCFRQTPIYTSTLTKRVQFPTEQQCNNDDEDNDNNLSNISHEHQPQDLTKRHTCNTNHR